MNQLSTGKDHYTRGSDFDDPLTSQNLPRGHGGISIHWPLSWYNIVKKFLCGNERIPAITMNVERKLCIIMSTSQQTIVPETLTTSTQNFLIS